MVYLVYVLSAKFHLIAPLLVAAHRYPSWSKVISSTKLALVYVVQPGWAGAMGVGVIAGWATVVVVGVAGR